jgi:carbonic anhydrase
MTDDLITGFGDFRRSRYSGDNPLMPKLVEDGQAPRYFVISCIDSRTDPGTIFQAQPGTFFGHKAMGAIVPPYKQGTALAAALQYALNYNQVDTIFVLGHTQCGAVKALVENLDDEEISGFVRVARRARDKANACGCTEHDLPARTEKEVILQSVENLKSYPSVQKALSENRLSIKPWLFDMKEARLLEYDERAEEFIVITACTNDKNIRKNV